jgi:hypothetical protein
MRQSFMQRWRWLTFFTHLTKPMRLISSRTEFIDMSFFKAISACLLMLGLALTGVAQTADKTPPSTSAPAPQTTPGQKPGAPQRRIPLSERADPTLNDVNTAIGVDKRVIVMMAALNVAGYDYEAANRPLTPLRQMIREDLKNLNPAIVRKLRDHFLAHRQGRAEVAAVAPYLSLALTMTEPPAFSIDVPSERLPDDVREITDFALLLEEFYREAGFTRLMPKYVNAFMQTAATYPTAAGEAIGNVLIYLHTDPLLELPPLYVVRPSEAELKTLASAKEKELKEKAAREKTKQDSQELRELARREAMRTLMADNQNRIRRFYIIPDLLNATGTANLRIVRDDYFLLLGPTTEPNIEAMRRSFLNFVLDPLAEKQVREVRAIGAPLKKLMETRGDKLDQEYASRSAYFLITDSLVRATDARMQVLELAARRQVKEDEALYELSTAYDRGAVLVFNFYDKIKAYEAVGVNIRDYYGDLLQNIDFEREAGRLNEYAQRFARIKQARLEAAAAPAPTLNIANADQKLVARLTEADQMMRQRRYADAKAVLEAAKKENATNARVLYGLAEVTSKQASTLTDSSELETELFAAVQLYKEAAENAAPDSEKWLAQRSFFAAGKILDFIAETQASADKTDDAVRNAADALAAYDLAIKLGKLEGGAYDEAVKAKEKLQVKPKNN